ncbi:MAG: hypothetical protein MJ187_04720, partial [Alphaproteobacteria bacterium]|nr:hypothetical protein [Alphaproteobacteria bacterium]
DAGLKYGFQMGDGNMIDDDITNGGAVGDELTTADGDILITQVQRVLSTGTSNGGNMLGFNAGIGLKDFIKWGNVKITPSIGYRYLKYKLETSKNFGISIDTAGCFSGPSGEIECEPAILVYNTSDGKYDGPIIKKYLVTYASENGYEIADGSQFLNPLNTYYAEQPDVSHSYEVTWSGPYIAADLEYIINANNFVNGRVELGLPSYHSVGDQPYRYDWAHPKSVEDTAGLGDGFHFGLGANYVTALTDKVSLSLGVTYDYYSVAGAEAKTYLNQGYYTDRFNDILKDYRKKISPDITESDILDPDGQYASAEAINIKALESECSGWACTLGGEIDSFYKSLGIRVGINAKF